MLIRCFARHIGYTIGEVRSLVLPLHALSTSGQGLDQPVDGTHLFLVKILKDFLLNIQHQSILEGMNEVYGCASVNTVGAATKANWVHGILNIMLGDRVEAIFVRIPSGV